MNCVSPKLPSSDDECIGRAWVGCLRGTSTTGLCGCYQELGIVYVLNSICIRRRNNLLSEETFQTGQISVSRDSDKGCQKMPLLSCIEGIVPAIGNVLTGTRDELAGVCFLNL
jgi:hypothetical protein